ncbi:hypothetical protein AB0945_24465 [Streptomyces sp. NPDC005474]|uniref:hypothetical protein n=1 Tax=Streptomyces sp. NPDC005474 TaxID=3154878 RepID=UPI0034565451
MSERVMSRRADGLITLAAADALWVGLTADSAVPTAPGAFTRSPAHARVGYVLLGGHVVATVGASGGQWSVSEIEVRRAAEALNAVGMDRQDLIGIGPFRGAPGQAEGRRGNAAALAPPHHGGTAGAGRPRAGSTT